MQVKDLPECREKKSPLAAGMRVVNVERPTARLALGRPAVHVLREPLNDLVIQLVAAIDCEFRPIVVVTVAQFGNRTRRI